MAQMPESLIEPKEFCSNCGRPLGEGSSFVKAVIEHVRDGKSVFVDLDKRYFCKDCLKAGVYINVRDPEEYD